MLGPWANANLAGTARAHAGVGADTDLPSHVRFVAGVAKLLRRRLAACGTTHDPARPAVFLLAQRVQSPGRTPAVDQLTRVPMLDNGRTAVTGRVWFTSDAVVTGAYFDLDDCDDDALFALVTEQLELGAVPAILFDPRCTPPDVRFYAGGLHTPESYEPIAVPQANVSLDRVLDAIDRVYESCLVTPEAQSPGAKLWKNQESWWPIARAEDTVQVYLKAGLTTAFPTCTVRHEQPDAAGRLDLEIEEADAMDPSRITRHALLELKVLRSYNESGRAVPQTDMDEWVLKGVRQAAAYRDRRGSRAAALCCFDMRRDNTGRACFAHVRELAASLQIELRAWFLFSTSERFRSATVGACDGDLDAAAAARDDA